MSIELPQQFQMAVVGTLSPSADSETGDASLLRSHKSFPDYSTYFLCCPSSQHSGREGCGKQKDASVRETTQFLHLWHTCAQVWQKCLSMLGKWEFTCVPSMDINCCQFYHDVYLLKKSLSPILLRSRFALQTTIWPIFSPRGKSLWN